MDFDVTSSLTKGIVIWLFVWALLIAHYRARPQTTMGLSFCFIAEQSMNYLLGAIIYALPWFESRSPYGQLPRHVALGFTQCVYSIVSYYIGNVIIVPIFLKKKIRKLRKPVAEKIPEAAPLTLDWREVQQRNRQRDIRQGKLVRVYMMLGIIFYFVLRNVLKGPSFSTLSSSGWTLIQVSVCLFLWHSYKQKRKIGFTVWLLVGGLFFPLFTMLTQGFLGFGIVAVLIMLCFMSVFYKPAWKLALMGVFFLYLGLSFFVNYLASREQIRAAVWGDQGVKAKQEVMSRMMKTFKFFDVHNQEQLEMIDIRLNQNNFVGLAIEHLRDGGKQFARGATLVDAVAAIVPRIFWPDKPVKAGGGSVVADYTGLKLSAETAWGIGAVMELYINFGTPAIVIGFLCLGIIVGIYDFNAAYYLFVAEDWPKAVFWFLPGLAFINSLASIAEIAMVWAASCVFMLLVNKYILRSGFLNVPRQPVLKT